MNDTLAEQLAALNVEGNPELNSLQPAEQEFRNMSLEVIAEHCLEWSIETFGAEKAAIRKLHHLKQEVEETIEILEKQEKAYPDDKSDYEEDILEEFADCMMLLTNSFMAEGYSFDDIAEAMHKKLEKNRLRTWSEPDENGVCNHTNED